MHVRTSRLAPHPCATPDLVHCSGRALKGWACVWQPARIRRMGRLTSFTVRRWSPSAARCESWTWTAWSTGAGATTASTARTWRRAAPLWRERVCTCPGVRLAGMGTHLSRRQKLHRCAAVAFCQERSNMVRNAVAAQLQCTSVRWDAPNHRGTCWAEKGMHRAWPALAKGR